MSPAPSTSRRARRSPHGAVTGISPDTGSTGGDTSVTITGTGIQAGATVTFDGIPQLARFDRYPNTIYLETSAHAAGTVDVVVTNLGGQPGLTARHTYASPQSFDFNGNWVGEVDGGSHHMVRFTIQNNLLVSMSCDSSTPLTLSPPPSIANGEFSVLGNEGVSVSGRIVSAFDASGAIDIAPCARYTWRAWRAANN